MSDLVGNPEDRFSQNEAHIIKATRIILLLSINVCYVLLTTKFSEYSLEDGIAIIFYNHDRLFFSSQHSNSIKFEKDVVFYDSALQPKDTGGMEKCRC